MRTFQRRNPGKSKLVVESFARPMPLSEVARLLGMGGDEGPRRLRRYLLQVERATGHEVMHRGGSPSRPHYTVTTASLREHCPELFDLRDVARAKQEVEQYLDAVVERIEGTETSIRGINIAIRTLTARIERLERSMRPASAKTGHE